MFAQVTRRTERAPLAPGRPGTWGSFKCRAQDAVRSSSAHIALLLAGVLGGGGGGCALRPGVSGPAVRSSDQAGKRSARRGSRATGPPICVHTPSVPARQVPTPDGQPWVLGSLLVAQRRNRRAKLGALGAAEPCSHRHTCQQVARDSRRLNTDRMRWKQSRGRPVSL